MGGSLKQAVRQPPVKRRDASRMSAGARRREEARRKARRARRLKAYGIPAAVVAVVVIVAVVVSLGGTGTGSKASPTTGPVTVSGPARSAPFQVGDRVPDFTARLLSGGSVRWSDYRGTPTVLAMWAPWCPHCQRELPILSEVMRGYPGVKLLSIVTMPTLHPGPSPDAFLRSRHLRLATALDDPEGTLANAMGLQAFPLVYYVDATGVVRQVKVGESPAAQIRANVGLILAT